MIDQKRKAFRDADFDSNTKPEDIKRLSASCA